MPNAQIPTAEQIIEQKLNVIGDINKAFPFLVGHFEVVALYNLDPKSDHVFAGWEVVIKSNQLLPNGNPKNLRFVLEDNLTMLVKDAVKELIKKDE